jgi:aspartate racemase
MRTIGILGGLGPESTMAYYSYITRTYYERYSDYRYPEIIIYSLSFSAFIESAYRLPRRTREAIEKMRLAGADFVVASCNSLHVIYREVSEHVRIPWISIMDATGQRIAEAGLSTVGLLGTMLTMSASFYQEALAKYDVDVVVPGVEIRERVDEIIFEELVRREIRDESRQFVVDAILRLEQSGAEGVVLGCTELPFLIDQEYVGIPVFDTTAIHAQKALDLALDDDLWRGVLKEWSLASAVR